jgi:hypothetical protein
MAARNPYPFNEMGKNILLLLPWTSHPVLRRFTPRPPTTLPISSHWLRRPPVLLWMMESILRGLDLQAPKPIAALLPGDRKAASMRGEGACTCGWRPGAAQPHAVYGTTEASVARPELHLAALKVAVELHTKRQWRAASMRNSVHAWPA